MQKAVRLAPIADESRRSLTKYLEDQGFADEESSGKKAAKESFFKDKLTKILQVIAPFQKLVVEGFLERLVFIDSNTFPARDQRDALMNVIEAEGPDMRGAMNLLIHSVEEYNYCREESHFPLILRNIPCFQEASFRIVQGSCLCHISLWRFLLPSFGGFTLFRVSSLRTRTFPL